MIIIIEHSIAVSETVFTVAVPTMLNYAVVVYSSLWLVK